MKPRVPALTTLRFVFIAVVMMLLMDQFVFGGKRSYIEEARTVSSEEKAAVVPEPVTVATLPETEAAPSPKSSPRGGEDFSSAAVSSLPISTSSPQWGEGEVPDVHEETPPLAKVEPEKIVPPPPAPIKTVEALRPSIHGKMKIAIVIDDMGPDVKRSRQVIGLPADITLAFLPYGAKTRELAAIAKTAGHRLIIHTPMQAVNGKLDIGPGGLKVGMNDGAFDVAFGKMLESFDGYDGINNHMGSRLTQDSVAMDRLMSVLKTKNLFFLDSKTIQSSVAAREARAAGVPYAERDVFLDHVETPGFVARALAETEKVARRKGYAIAIGHPKDVTIAGLRAWIPTLEAKGIELVPVRDLLTKPKSSIMVEKENARPALPTNDEPMESLAAKAAGIEPASGLNLSLPVQKSF